MLDALFCMQNLKPSWLDTVAESEALPEGWDIHATKCITYIQSLETFISRHPGRVRSSRDMYATRRSFYMQSLKPSQLDAVAELNVRCSLLYSKLNAFITRHRSRIRSSPWRLGHLRIEAHLLYAKLKTFISRHHSRALGTSTQRGTAFTCKA